MSVLESQKGLRNHCANRLPGDAAGNHGSGGRYEGEGGLTEEEEE